MERRVVEGTAIYNSNAKISHCFYACVLSWIFSQLSHLVSLGLSEVNVSQSRNYPAERGVRPNSLEPPLCTGLL